jgi:glycosyltransferase involved in cell wall biosynthesis
MNELPEAKPQLPSTVDRATAFAKNPLVTFVIQAYNQEQCIREAIQGAFAQTYQPLEIILSDDCSTDRTFEIMQEMAAKYRGPHRVRVYRMNFNQGILTHFLTAARLAEGSLLIGAAGDDISKPERTAVLVDRWQATGAWAVCSKFDRIDHSSNLLAQSVSPLGLKNTISKYLRTKNGKQISIIHGATAAYDVRLFSHLKHVRQRCLYEDKIMAFLLICLDKDVAYSNESLILYRMHDEAVVHRPPGFETSGGEHELRAKLWCQNQFELNEALLQVYEELTLSGTCSANVIVKIKKIRRDADRFALRASWDTKSPISRVASLLFDTFNFSDLRWKALRLRGERQNYKPKSSVLRLLAWK